MPIPRRRHAEHSTPTTRAAPARQVVITPPRPPFVADASAAEISGEEGLEEMMEEAEIEEGDDDDDGDDEKPSATDLSNLREISSLASWTVSTYKPSCGIAALRHPSPSYFWQSDGPQPHLLNIHFFKLVSIVKIRVYLDFELDESYTPTKMVFLAGMGAYDLTEFGVWEGEGPRGWVEVELGGVGGGDGEDVSEEDEDEGEGGMKERERERGGGVLRAMLVQVRVCENHQNGKDTHVRGLQIFARDEKGRKGGGGVAGRKSEGLRDGTGKGEVVGLEEPEWMREPELR